MFGLVIVARLPNALDSHRIAFKSRLLSLFKRGPNRRTTTGPTFVSFKCRAHTLAAHLYTPVEGSPCREGAAVIVCPPWTGVKEQAPTNYARHLAAAGFTCLPYDAVIQGESSGEPRFLEDPSYIKAAVTYLVD